jgi:hypothetical protein
VEVSNLANTVTAQNSITIEAVQPEIYVYENNTNDNNTDKKKRGRKPKVSVSV